MRPAEQVEAQGFGTFVIVGTECGQQGIEDAFIAGVAGFGQVVQSRPSTARGQLGELLVSQTGAIL
ncbi:hypothetical protein SD37_39605 [Amycolatopsis orientalis]|uniref:Uncharacterized protein n=1 Tax=Amycolatopsis orientalis TaxID=31958 RepID=A0A193C9U5_AMYOR|nr:hypothetical protein SD37_39605 [Amycolatopsis orientalis]